MQNYMKKQVLEEGYKPRYYHRDRVITGGHVARFYDACLGRMANGGGSDREILDDVPLIQAAMTKGASEDLTTCLHYSNDWDPKDDGVWDDLYNDPKVVADLSISTATYRLKHGQLEDGYSKWITTDESQVAGWYYSVITIGPAPKPIQTGATLDTSACILKIVSLYDFMLDPFKHKGYCVVMDSAYMRDAMCQVGREEWKINMVGTCQTDHNVVPALLGRLLLLARISRLLLTVMSLSSFSTRPSH
ncbi:hypothetical protein FRACYDRAFT_245661 [Fragilariopsis cylindrus CCMP1102]|uniref:PiggyBac transposable element-derived protein domain-containing protein n=1 Tax=Fragilariopsis cylindrus CCMP1102 TaxID=635003 RepID=A0A1E7EZG4_9STRA|nr:hypothetical protein FRACYDRAFT_245661 [Fragilariopsis cylindrus CCMP1102]|eukprot:OEU11342.1 hypothetical protein FRACYDRAFT_245661 [Fragilariopsis cylindrus CCMP1102]